MKTIIYSMLIFCYLASMVLAQDWKSSPYNWQNSPYNCQNSPYNYKNSPYNYNNSPYKYGNDRIIRDNQGRDTGLYVVPRNDGGANVFDRNGDRRGYLPGNDGRDY